MSAVITMDSLRAMRMNGERNSYEILKLGKSVLGSSTSFNDEVWSVYEQVCLAAFDCGDDDTAHMCVTALRNKFPDSVRVKRLVGMHAEAVEEWQTALDLYDTILKADPTNSTILKRKVAVYKGMKDSVKAIEFLVKYLETFMTDTEAWAELGTLYVSVGELLRAAFCVEELMLLEPHNHFHFCLYADIKYTHGGQSNYILARRYYSRCLELNPDNIRAKYGLLLAAAAVSSTKGAATVIEDNNTIAEYAATELVKSYCDARSPLTESVNKGLEGLLKTTD